MSPLVQTVPGIQGVTDNVRTSSAGTRPAGRRGSLRALLLGLGLAWAGCGDSGEVAGGSGSLTTSSASTGDVAAPTTSGGAASSEAGSEDTGEDGSGTGEPGGSEVSTSSAASTSSAESTGPAGSTSSAGPETDGLSGTTGEAGESSDTGSEGGTSETGGEAEPEPEPVPGPKVKIMTFNIRVGTAADGEDSWDKRKGLVFQVFKDQDADFIGVQEALRFQLLAIDEAVPQYQRIGVGTVDGKTKGPYNAIYYRKSRFALKKSQTFWLSNTPEEAGSQTWGNKFPRAVTWGRFVEKDSDYTFYIYNTHFDHVSQNSREKAAVLLSKRIADRGIPDAPFAVMGDLNAGEGNLAIKYLKSYAKIDGKENEVKMRDTFRVAHPDATNVGTAHGFNGGTGGNKIDYIFVPPKQKVNGASIDHFNVKGRYPSDHFPVVGTVTFEDQ